MDTTRHSFFVIFFQHIFNYNFPGMTQAGLKIGRQLLDLPSPGPTAHSPRSAPGPPGSGSAASCCTSCRPTLRLPEAQGRGRCLFPTM